MRPAWILGHYFNALSLVRMLARKGVPTLLITDQVESVARYSRYPRVLLSPPFKDFEKARAFLDALLEQAEEAPLIFPTRDHHALLLAKYFLDQPDRVLPLCSSVPELLLSIDKYQTMEKVAPEGVQVPATELVFSDASLRSALQEVGFPLIIKAKENAWAGPRLINAENQEQLEAQLPNPIDWSLGQALVQERIPGDASHMHSYCVCTDSKGTIVAEFTGRKIRGYPLAYGDCFMGFASPMDDLLEAGNKAQKKLKLKGIIEYEFKRHPETSEFYFLEANPRSWSWVGATESAGINFAWLAYQAWVYGKLPEQELPIRQTRSDFYWMRLIDDFFNLVLYMDQPVQSRSQAFRLWLKGLMKTRSFGDFSLRDPGPWVHALGRFFKRGFED